MNRKKVIGSLVYLLGVILLGIFTDDFKSSLLLSFGVLAMIAGWELMDG